MGDDVKGVRTRPGQDSLQVHIAVAHVGDVGPQHLAGSATCLAGLSNGRRARDEDAIHILVQAAFPELAQVGLVPDAVVGHTQGTVTADGISHEVRPLGGGLWGVVEKKTVRARLTGHPFRGVGQGQVDFESRGIGRRHPGIQA